MRLAGKIALVAGASSGIGRAVALRFAGEGANVAIVARRAQKLAEVEEEIKAQGGNVLSIPADLTSSDDVQRLVAACVRHYGGLHVMFNGAGGSGRRFGDGPIDLCTDEGWDATLNMNLRPVFLLCKYGIPALESSGGGSIVNLSSVLGLLADKRFDAHAYATAKAAVIGLTRAIAVHYAHHNIRCNALCPGLVATEMSRRAQDDPGIVASMSEKQPLSSRVLTPEDVTGAALFLASDDSRMLTGLALPVDAGWSAQ